MAVKPPATKPPPPPNPMRSVRFWVILGILLLANIVVSNLLFAAAQPTPVTRPYDVCKEQVAQGNVTRVTTTGDSITGVTKTPVKETSTGVSATHFTTQRPSFADDSLEPLLEQHGVTINAKPENPPPPLGETLLLSVGPTLLVVLAVPDPLRGAAGGRGGARPAGTPHHEQDGVSQRHVQRCALQQRG